METELLILVRIQQMESSVAHVARELESLHNDLRDVLNTEEYDALARSHTDAIPSASTSAELKCIVVAINAWCTAEWISADVRATIADCMKASCLAANTARAAAVAAESSQVGDRDESGTRDEPGAAQQLAAEPSIKKSRINQSIALQNPVLQADQRSIVNMMGAKIFTHTVRMNGQKERRSLEVVAFAPNRLAPPPPSLKCSFGCGETFLTVQARLGHEVHRHGGRDGLSRDGSDIFGRARRLEAKAAAQSVIDTVIMPAVMANIYQLELERNPQEREAIEAAQREREAKRNAEAEAKHAADVLAKAERARRTREREEAGGGRRGELKRHQYTAMDKVEHLEVFDRIRFDPSIINKGEAFTIETGVAETNVMKWAKPEERAKISRGGANAHAHICEFSSYHA